MSKMLGSGLSLLGVLLIVGSIVLAAFIVPGLKVFPDDVDTTRVYELDYLTLLNSDTLSFFNAAPGENPDLRIERHLVSKETDGNKTQIEETQTIYNGDEVLLQNVEYHLVDRKTLEFLAEDETPAAWKELPGYIPRDGLVMGWGLSVEKRDYDGWTDDYQITVPLTFQREEEHGGIHTYYFTAEHEARQIEETYLDMMGLPKSLSIEQLQGLASGIESLDAMTRMALPILVEGAVKDVREIEEDAAVDIPLVYYFDYWGEYWVEPTTGVLINTRKYENRTVTFPEDVMAALKVRLEGMGRNPDDLDKLLPLTVNAFEYEASTQSIEDAVQDAEDAKATINTFETTVPMGLFVIGLLLVIFGRFVRVAL